MLEIAFILILILLNGFFAAAEMAFVTARASRLRKLAEQGDRRAARVLKMKENSGDFLATVQVGVTLVATLASAVGGASAARALAPQFETIFGSYAEQVALGVIVVVISYATLVVGELVPKQLAIRFAEPFTLLTVRPLSLLQRLLWLPIRFLDWSSNMLLKLTGDVREQLEIESAEEISLIVQQAASDGVIDSTEEDLITRVFDYAGANLADIMTPRPNIQFLHQSDTALAARIRAHETGFSRFVVINGELDEFIGYLHIKDLLLTPDDEAIVKYVRPLQALPETLRIPIALKRVTSREAHLAVVLDEFGSVSGIVTLEDILEEIVGEIEDEHRSDSNMVEQLDENSWLFDGATSLLDVKSITGVELPETSDYNTVAGFFIHAFGALPKKGATLTHGALKLTVERISKRRIADIRINIQPAN